MTLLKLPRLSLRPRKTGPWGAADAEYCSRRHPMTDYESAGCDAAHHHRIYTCWWRVGVLPCGDVVVVPPFGSACGDSDDD